MKYHELSETAQEKARSWYRAEGISYEWWDTVFEDVTACLKLLGFDATESVGRDRKTKEGQTHMMWVEESTIKFSGFSSRGDCASFTGTWAAARVNMSALMAHAPLDETLTTICAKLSVTALQYTEMTAVITRKAYHYSSEMAMDVECCFDTEQYEVGDWDQDMVSAASVVEVMAREAARWVYSQLEKEYDYLQSNECVADNISCNEYDFTEEGEFQ